MAGEPGLVDTATARRLTVELGAAIHGVRRAVEVLAARVHAAHQAKVWTTLGYSSWADYARAEFGIGRSHAYRLLGIAATVHTLSTAVGALAALSPTGDSGDGIEVFGLSGRALRDIASRVDQVVEHVTARVNAAAAAAGGWGPGQTVRGSGRGGVG
ncbi:hypothetical protein F0L68_41350, partial [Solihabitans fulvus]